MPSLTRVPITCAARQITAVAALPSARLAPNMASAISTGQMAAEPPAMKADSSSEAGRMVLEAGHAGTRPGGQGRPVPGTAGSRRWP